MRRAFTPLFAAALGLLGCEPPKPTCIVPPGEGFTAMKVVTTDQPVVRLLPLNGPGRFPVTKMVAEVRADEPLLALDVAENMCAHGAVCSPFFLKDLPSAVAGQTIPGEGSARVIGRFAAGEAATLDLLASRQVYLVRLAALSAPALGTISVRTTLEAVACAPVPKYGYMPWRLETIEIPRAFRCGDGLLQQGEMCDDGNSIDGDGCEVRDQTCQLSKASCDPGRAGVWHAFRCAGRPTRCEELECHAGRDNPPECDSSRGNSAEGRAAIKASVQVVVSGRTRGPVRAEVRTGRGDEVCSCTETGFRLECDPSCEIPMACARLEVGPPAPGLSWVGFSGATPGRSAHPVDNLSQHGWAVATFSAGESRTMGPSLRLSSLQSAEVTWVHAAAAATDGSEWFAFDTTSRSGAGLQETRQHLVRLAEDRTTHLTPPGAGERGRSELLAMAPDADGGGVWTVTATEGRVFFKGQPLEPASSSKDDVRLVLAHVSATDTLWGFHLLAQGSSISTGFPRALVSAARPSTPYRAAMLSVTRGEELALQTFDPRAAPVWQRSFGIVKTASSVPTLREGPGGHLWASFRSSEALHSPDFPALDGRSGSVLLVLSPTGKLTSHIETDVLASALSEDGQSMWTLEDGPGSKTTWLRKRDARGDVLIEHVISSPREKDASFDLLSMPNDELIIGRRGSSGVVLARWQVSKATLTMKWIERVAPAGERRGDQALTWDPRKKAIRVMTEVFADRTRTSRMYVAP